MPLPLPHRSASLTHVSPIQAQIYTPLCMICSPMGKTSLGCLPLSALLSIPTLFSPACRTPLRHRLRPLALLETLLSPPTLPCSSPTTSPPTGPSTFIGRMALSPVAPISNALLRHCRPCAGLARVLLHLWRAPHHQGLRSRLPTRCHGATGSIDALTDAASGGLSCPLQVVVTRHVGAVRPRRPRISRSQFTYVTAHRPGYPPMMLTSGGGSCLVLQIILWATSRCAGRAVRLGLNEAPTRGQTSDHSCRFLG